MCKAMAQKFADAISGLAGWCRKRDSNTRPHHYE
jgi:hypothetical protein